MTHIQTWPGVGEGSVVNCETNKLICNVTTPLPLSPRVTATVLEDVRLHGHDNDYLLLEVVPPRNGNHQHVRYYLAETKHVRVVHACMKEYEFRKGYGLLYAAAQQCIELATNNCSRYQGYNEALAVELYQLRQRVHRLEERQKGRWYDNMNSRQRVPRRQRATREQHQHNEPQPMRQQYPHNEPQPIRPSSSAEPRAKRHKIRHDLLHHFI